MNPGFFPFLHAQPAILAAVGDRVFPQIIPQHLFEQDPLMDCIVWRRLGIDTQPLFCGSDDLVRGTFEFDCYSPDYDRACALNDTLRHLLLDYRGLMGTVQVGPILLDTSADAQPEPLPGLFVEAAVYTVWYWELAT